MSLIIPTNLPVWWAFQRSIRNCCIAWPRLWFMQMSELFRFSHVGCVSQFNVATKCNYVSFECVINAVNATRAISRKIIQTNMQMVLYPTPSAYNANKPVTESGHPFQSHPGDLVLKQLIISLGMMQFRYFIQKQHNKIRYNCIQCNVLNKIR